MILEESSLITPHSSPIAASRPDAGAPAVPASVDTPTDGPSLEDNERGLLRITRDTLPYKMKKFNRR
jgi:hypothetical protein